MRHSNTSAAALLVENLSLFASLAEPGSQAPRVLDLACGNGRNGLLLASRGWRVCFADRDQEKLTGIASQAVFAESGSELWQVDLEVPGTEPLADRQFDAIVVFNYLHRPLMPALRSALRPGGLLMYETFTEAQREFGRPRNPDFLLKAGELRSYFQDWQILHSEETVLSSPARAVARLIVRRPEAE
jgi:SAM-dependent methyltransferase